MEIFEGFSTTITHVMSESLMRDITKRELSTVVTTMAKGKALGHDGIPVEFFQQL